MRTRPAVPAIVLLCALLTASAARQEVAQPPLRHEVSVRLVLVDLAAVDKDGRFVPGLTRDDFEVFEDGKKVTLKSASLVRPGQVPSGEEAAASTPPAVLGRDNSFFVVVDSINTIKRMLDRERPKILAKLESLVETGEQVMVLEMAESGEVKVLQALTRDKALIAGAVGRAAGSIWVERAPDTLSLPNILAQGGQDFGPSDEPPMKSKFDKTNRDIYELETRRRFEKTINGLLVVLNIVKDYAGRKSILYISGGIPAVSFGSFFSGQGGTVQDTTVIQSQVAAARIQDPFKSLRKQDYRSGQDILEDLVRFANSHNISFYALDPDNYLRYVLGDIAYDNWARSASTLAGQRADGVYREDEVAEIKKSELAKLQDLTSDTGGLAFLGANRFEEFQRVIERDLGSYYELSYVPPRKEPDGKYHSIKVRLARPGIAIRFRPGYMDYDDMQKESLLFASAAYNPSLFKDIPFEARVVPFVRGRDSYALWIQTALPYASVVGPNTERDRPVPLKFKIIVNEEGGEAGLLSEVALPLVLTPAFLKKNEGVEYIGFNCASQDLELSAGSYRVRVILYNQSIGEAGVVERTVSVPGRKKGEEGRIINAVLGSLARSDGSSGSAFSISAQDGALDLPGYKFFPLAVNEVDRTKVVSAALQVAAPGPEAKLQAELVLYEGERLVSPLSSKEVVSSWNKKASVWNIICAFVLGDFPSGDYTLKIRLADPSGRTAAETDVPLRIL